MYILANGVKISEKAHQRLCRAVKDTRGKYFYFLDMVTGKLVRVLSAQHQKLAAIRKETGRFIPLPKVSKRERRERFVAFVEELGIIDVPELQKRLSKEIKKGASIDELERMLENDPSGWIHGWVQDEQFLLAERIEEWITGPPLSARDDPDYWFDDNCPVCQMMRKAEEEGRVPTTRETQESFLQAKEKGALVGGELLKKSKSHKEEDLLDQEVNEMLQMAKSNKFEPGIYNFCDRWCEKCKDTEKCFLFAQEQQRKARKLLNGKLNGDEEFLEEVKHSFALTRRLIERDLQKQGVDLRKALEQAKNQKNWDDDANKRYDRVRCLILARRYMKDVRSFLEEFHQSRFQFYPELGMEVDFSDIKDEIETISWYHTMLPVKVWRFLYEKESLEREEDEELKELMAKDLPKYSLLVKKCIQKSKTSWQDLAKKRDELALASLQFVAMLNKIKNEFKELSREIEQPTN